MKRNRFTEEQIIGIPGSAASRQHRSQTNQTRTANPKASPSEREQFGDHVSISDQSYYRWRKEYGGLDLDQTRRMKDLEKENSRLKRLVADLPLEKQILKDIASGNL